MGLSPDALYHAICSDVSHLALRGNPEDYVGLSYKQYAATSLTYNIVRKWIPSDPTLADAAAYESFVAANNRCKEWVLPDLSLMDSMILAKMRKIIDDFCHPQGELLVQSYYDLLRRSRPGPGAAIGAIGTSFYTKFMASRLTVTSEYLYHMYRSYTEWLPSYGEAEEYRRQKMGSHSIVNGSRCSFVPKTSATSRMICVEPSLNMFYQLGLGAILEDRLRQSFGIDLTIQPEINQRLARVGSLDGSLSTIDLSSASDSISLRLVENLFPRWFFELLLSLRSRCVDIDGKSHPLWMISTMGNGFTFPLQTVIFSALLKAVSDFHQGQHCGTGTFSCFGDDLICESFCFPTVVRVLGHLGFRVNTSKTFTQGPFRESCGADWFLGQSVRPVFVKKLATPSDLLVTINRLNAWTAITGIPLRNTYALLRSRLARKFLTYVPLDSAEDAGIKVHSFFINPKYDGNLSCIYRCHERVPSRIRIGEGEVRLPNGRKCMYNPQGLYISFLYGELVSSTIMVRHDLRRYRTRRRVTPNWDHLPLDRHTNGLYLSTEQWKTALLANLS